VVPNVKVAVSSSKQSYAASGRGFEKVPRHSQWVNRYRPVTSLKEWKSYEPLLVGVGGRQFVARFPQCSATVFGIAGQDIVGPGGLTREVSVPFEVVCSIRRTERRRGRERWRSEGRGERIEGWWRGRPPRCRAREADGCENGLSDFRARARARRGLGIGRRFAWNWLWRHWPLGTAELGAGLGSGSLRLRA
jgi:hypothetical protein